MSTVYWSPWYLDESLYPKYQFLYDEPTSLISEIRNERDQNNKGDNWYQCHAFNNTIQNTFVLKSPISVDFAFHKDFGIIDTGTKPIENLMFCAIKNPSMVGKITFAVQINWIFWSDKPLEISSMQPYMTRPVYDGFYVPGTFDINQWFRPLELASQLHEGANRVQIDRDDPLAYVKFNTKESVKLQRFYLTPELKELSNACIDYKRNNPNRSLKYLYERFTKNGLQNKINREIKNNLI